MRLKYPTINSIQNISSTRRRTLAPSRVLQPNHNWNGNTGAKSAKTQSKQAIHVLRSADASQSQLSQPLRSVDFLPRSASQQWLCSKGRENVRPHRRYTCYCDDARSNIDDAVNSHCKSCLIEDFRQEIYARQSFRAFRFFLNVFNYFWKLCGRFIFMQMNSYSFI